MTSLIAGTFAGTWSLISSSAEVITGARRLTVRIHRLLQPGGQLDLSGTDQRRLLGLQKRVECLVSPLNFLLLWSKNRDSCVQQVVLSAQELLFDVCSFVERFAPQEMSPRARSKATNKEPCIDSDRLDYYLRELDFACASVTMALTIAQVAEVQPTLGARSAGALPRHDSVSLSALLRASRRIQEMHGRGGDLCAFTGCLYSQAASNGHQGSERHNGNGRSSEWAQVLSLATFKIVSTVASEGKVRRRRYGIQVESRLPLSLADGLSNQSSSGGIYEGLGDEHGFSLNASDRLDFSVDAALDADLVVTSQLALPTGSSRCLARDLGVDSVALVWSESPQDAASAGLPPDAVLLPQPSAGGSQPAFGAVGSLDLASVWHGRLAGGSTSRCPSPGPAGMFGGSPSAGRRYAFVFDGPQGMHGGSGGLDRGAESDYMQTPLDVIYLARLCAMDDVSSGPEAGATAHPPHLLTSDEALAALLLQEGSAVSGALVAPTASACTAEKTSTVQEKRRSK